MAPRLTDGEREVLAEIEADARPSGAEIEAFMLDDEDRLDTYNQAVRLWGSDDSWHSRWDDDPNPYEGTYSEE